MVHYVRDNVAVCGFAGIGKREEFARHGFHAQLQCTGPFDEWLPECCEVLSVPFDDGLPIPESAFRDAQSWLGQHWDRRSKILISCAAGQSRSVTMTIALLRLKGGLSFLEAAHQVLDRVPGAYPHPHILVSAARYCGDPLSFEELQAVYARVPVQPPYPWAEELLREALLLK